MERDKFDWTKPCGLWLDKMIKIDKYYFFWEWPYLKLFNNKPTVLLFLYDNNQKILDKFNNFKNNFEFKDKIDFGVIHVTEDIVWNDRDIEGIFSICKEQCDGDVLDNTILIYNDCNPIIIDNEKEYRYSNIKGKLMGKIKIFKDKSEIEKRCEHHYETTIQYSITIDEIEDCLNILKISDDYTFNIDVSKLSISLSQYLKIREKNFTSISCDHKKENINKAEYDRRMKIIVAGIYDINNKIRENHCANINDKRFQNYELNKKIVEQYNEMIRIINEENKK